MSVSVSMPQLGESVTEGTVTRWLKKEGDRVERDEPLLEISTDKVDTEIPSPAAGILRGIAVAEDETVAVGAELATIDDDSGASGGSAAGGSVDSAAQDAPTQDAPAQAAPAPQAEQAPSAPQAPPAQPAEPAQPAQFAQPAQSAQTAQPAQPQEAVPPPAAP